MASLAFQILFVLRTAHSFLQWGYSTYFSFTFQNCQEGIPHSWHFCFQEEFSLEETEGLR